MMVGEGSKVEVAGTRVWVFVAIGGSVAVEVAVGGTAVSVGKTTCPAVGGAASTVDSITIIGMNVFQRLK